MRLDPSAPPRERDPRILVPRRPDRSAPTTVVAARLAPPPLPAGVVRRDRVSALLDAATARPLTVVVAPAGHGRTIALSAWAATSPLPCAWLTLDREDDDPRHLWAHLLAALDGPFPGALQAADRGLWLGDDLLGRVLPATADALARATSPRAILVLDDAHHVRSARSWEALRTLFDALPAAVRVVVSSRSAPPLRLARRRAGGSLAALGADDLAFRADETTALLAVAGAETGDGDRRRWAADATARPDAERRARLAGRLAAGWAAGLALTADALVRTPARRTAAEARADAEAALAAYVAEEIVDPADPPLREFLLRSAVLDRLTGPLCAAVLDDPAAPAQLTRAREAGLLVGRTGGPLRHRAPLRDALLLLLQEREPALVPALHERASRVLEADGRIGAAVLHAEGAGDPVRAETLAENHVRALAGPPYDARPVGGDGWPWAGSPEDAVRAGRTSAATTEEAAPVVRAATVSVLGQALWLAGDADGARAVLEPLVGGMAHPAPRCWSLAVLALAVGDEDAERAERLARHARRIARRPDGTWLERVLAHQALADALRRRGAHDEARDAVSSAAACTLEADATLHHVLTLLLRAELALAARDHAAASRAAGDARERLDLYPGPGVLESRLAATEASLSRPEDRLQGSEPTPAELRLLALLPTDLTRREIGAELFVSVDTVKTHLWRLYRRLGVETRAEAVEAARARGLLPVRD